jgi:C-terminal processing protease CtpA/Prc
MLDGYIYYENHPGWVGFRWNDYSHVVNKVYPETPAQELGMKPGDEVLLLDPKTGYAGELVIIKIRRGDQILLFKTYRKMI